MECSSLSLPSFLSPNSAPSFHLSLVFFFSSSSSSSSANTRTSVRIWWWCQSLCFAERYQWILSLIPISFFFSPFRFPFASLYHCLSILLCACVCAFSFPRLLLLLFSFSSSSSASLHDAIHLNDDTKTNHSWQADRYLLLQARKTKRELSSSFAWDIVRLFHSIFDLFVFQLERSEAKRQTSLVFHIDDILLTCRERFSFSRRF